MVYRSSASSPMLDGCHYKANKKASMTGEIFREWLQKFSLHIELDRQVVLINIGQLQWP